MEKLGAVIRYFVLCASDFCVCWGGRRGGGGLRGQVRTKRETVGRVKEVVLSQQR